MMRTIDVVFGSGNRIVALGSGSQPHKCFWDQLSESIKNWGSGIKFYVKQTNKQANKQANKQTNNKQTKNKQTRGHK